MIYLIALFPIITEEVDIIICELELQLQLAHFKISVRLKAEKLTYKMR